MAKPRLGGKDRQFAGLPAIAALRFVDGIAARLAPDGPEFEPAAQGRVVVLDLGEQVAAGGDHALKRFFERARRRA